MGFLVVYLERHIQTIDYFFFLLWNLLILILQIMEHLTAGTTFFLCLFSLAFFFIVHHGLERRLRMHFRHSLGSVNISGGGFIDLGDGTDWGWEMGMNGGIHGRRNISC